MASENGAIWQVQDSAANGTESTATATNTVLFNESPVTATGGFIFNTEANFRNSTPENLAVSTNNNEVQDMGFDGLDVQITGILFDSETDTASTKLNKLIRFMKEAKTATDYPEGRFGLRLDDLPQLNVVPDANVNSLGKDYGYVLADLRIIHSGQRERKVEFLLTLRFSGDFDNAF